MPLLQAGVRAAFLNSSQDYATASETERRLRMDELDLIYVAPERLLTERFLGVMDHPARQESPCLVCH